MKAQLFSICLLLMVATTLGACYGESSSNTATMKPGAPLGSPAGPAANAPIAGQPASAGNAPVATIPSTAPTPAATGAGPGTAMQMPSSMQMPMSMSSASGTAVSTDNENIYVLQNGVLYRIPKSSVGTAGVAVQSAPAVCAAGPAVCGPGPVTYIPGFESSSCTVTTITPCPPVCPPQPTGCGPAPCPPSPSTIVTCTPVCPTYCNPCPKPCSVCASGTPCNQCNVCRGNPCASAQNATVCSTTTACPVGAGPCAVPAIATVSPAAQAMITCLQGLCGAEADKAFLQYEIQLNQSVLALDYASIDYLGTTRLQDWATNSIADSRSTIAKSSRWLRDKYCTNVATCNPAGPMGIDICNITRRGSAFDQAYTNQMVQYYVDEISLAQVEIRNGLDCQVKAWAADIIRDRQTRISRLGRCNTCL